MILDLSLCAVVGFVEWMLACWRTVLCAHGRAARASLLVFAEQFLGLAVLRYAISADSWSLLVVYCAGGALGAYVAVRRTV